ncbi:alkaline phosphatase family protein [Winogradskyella ursingii]|uniref:alkaline phosphatase family protein n=1 Tax=Winogradskyella ursingii TaxID=2686079 RepID=UPI0015CB060C|nr:alkaline phosphatase family protein [Winogradskyella ursingii]
MSQNKNKLLLIGWDAADWKLIGPLIAKGHMPALKSIIDDGVYGNMSTMNPPFSPMLWTSVATGKTPDKHGVQGFIELMPDMQGIRPVTTNSRTTRALWNIFHNQGLKSNLVGWWPSFPAEPINGVVVSDKFQKVSKDPKKPSPIIEGCIHPKEMVSKLKNLRMFPHEITSEHILPFIPQAAKVDQEKDNGLSAFAKMMAQTVSLHNASTYLQRETDWDFMAIYHDYIDHFCHAFMKFHPPLLPGVPEERYEIYKDCINGAYRFQDMMLGRTLELIDDDTTVIIMSDHGYEAGINRILKMPKLNAAPALEHRQFGIFVAKGPHIKKKEKVFGLGLIDIAPTILHHFNLPIGKDMDGKVALDIFTEPRKPKYIKSWDDLDGDFGESEKEKVDRYDDQEAMEQLIELGYIDRPDEKKEVAIKKTKCDLKQNLASVFSGKKDFAKAKNILLELITEKEPIDIAPYLSDLIAICIATKSYDEAEKYLNQLKKQETTINFNYNFIESEILTGQGFYKKAIEVLKNIKLTRRNSSEYFFRLGNLNALLGNYEEAKGYLENAIEIEPDKAKYQRLMAEIYYQTKEYEESAEHALTAIELVKYFPDAHYVLGKALEKLGDLKNAKIAFETASALKPKTFRLAEIAKENISNKLLKTENKQGNLSYLYYKNQIVIVSGLPRSGTSLMMQMLDKAGLDILTDGKRKANESNPKGFYEYEPVMSIHKDNGWLTHAQDHVVKVVAPLLKHLDLQYRYKVIFMTRDLGQVVASQQKMVGKDPESYPTQLINNYKKLIKSVDNWNHNQPGVELIQLNYLDVINSPKQCLETIENFIGLKLNTSEAIKCVDKSLYRNRV